ncbi:MAG: bifunctional UDP-N-acetylglucosamine diphosphorylase/glucosamine-1-phosphate N-acetyltransferase GlmU [Peptococcaceae bacterium]|nr:bifunctional UDP-N-acetylglucosamine diphosphorylase/glucosamine-1-phosphate N-acetyltransferase GlmU [Peptococcaceae bacterium]
MALAAVILAAGKGTRMKSRRPKVLHPVAGLPMLHHVLRAVQDAGAQKVIVVAGYGFEQVKEAVAGQAEVVCQEEQLGTAHAVMQAEHLLQNFEGDILVVCGDTPLITGATLAALVAHHRNSRTAATVLTTELENPYGYGRVIRDNSGMVVQVVEQKDATAEEQAVKEINTGIYCFAAAGFFAALKEIGNANRQGEYYLPDIIGIYRRHGYQVASYRTDNPDEILGVNDRRQLAVVADLMRRRILDELMLSGVTVIDPASTFVDRGVVIAPDTVIAPFSLIEGNSVIGEDCRIGPYARLVDARIGSGVQLMQSTVIEAYVADRAVVGPYAYLRPGTRVGTGAKVGDFVELKKAIIGDGSKVPHLSYVGDAEVGAKVNIGAGTITCNYDGEKKHRTVIEDGAFIGSNANLVAPVRIGRGAYVAAGSTITEDVPAAALGVARSRQTNIEDWVTRKKGRKGHTGGS